MTDKNEKVDALDHAAHVEAKRRYGTGRDAVIRRVGFEDGAAWQRQRCLIEPDDLFDVINPHVDDNWGIATGLIIDDLMRYLREKGIQ